MQKNAGQKDQGADKKGTAAKHIRGKGANKISNVVKLDTSRPETAVPLFEGADAEKLIFALDIGTRTVVGITGIQEEKFRIISTEVIEHKTRAMFDGQIHDIGEVAAVVGQIKQRTEAKLGITLKKVAIAAAGRMLRTCQVRVETELEPGAEIDRELVGSLEIEGIQKAQAELDGSMTGDDGTNYYCVGYSVLNYYLNGLLITKLDGHKGRTAAADILATFLPHVVVDSLYTVMNRAGLEVSSLTLEPIAAINVTIPADLRLLNLALVDIGAGTSDIALTRDGSVVAYAMVPVAGDEITETISQHFLVDFNTAEKIKILYSSGKESISFIDIMKNKVSIKAEEIAAVIAPTTGSIAETIARKIVEYNGKAPNAVFLIGGGSQTAGLAAMLADNLKLHPDRVVVRGRDVIRNVKFNDRKLTGPESITPYGIAVTAQAYVGSDFLNVSVNGRKIKLFNSKKLTVADALILLGFNPGQLIGRSGRSLSFELNGERKIIRGEHGKPAEIYLNREPASLESYIRHGDNITVIPAEEGRNAAVRISGLLGEAETAAEKVMMNGNLVDVGIEMLINGKKAVESDTVSDGDRVEIIGIRTLGELLEAVGSGKKPGDLLVNGRKADAGYLLKNYDIIDDASAVSHAKTAASVTTGPAPATAADPYPAAVHSVTSAGTPAETHAAAPVPAPAPSGSAKDMEGKVVITVNGDAIALAEKKTDYIFVDVFNHINFDLSKPQGNIALKLNGNQASFTDVIKSGDIIEIYWDK